MLGDCLLVAPVFSETAESRDVYLPGPAAWRYLWDPSQALYESGSDGYELTDFSAEPGTPPVFVNEALSHCSHESLFGTESIFTQFLQ